jgi:hypothetical protein
MKNYLFLLAAVVIFLNGVGAREVSAQGARAVEAAVAFDFRVGDQTYPAGVYRLEAMGEGNFLELRKLGENGLRHLIAVDAAQKGRRERPKLVFRRVGGDYYLSGVFLGGDGWGFALRPARRGREGEKRLASQTGEVPAGN